MQAIFTISCETGNAPGTGSITSLSLSPQRGKYALTLKCEDHRRHYTLHANQDPVVGLARFLYEDLDEEWRVPEDASWFIEGEDWHAGLVALCWSSLETWDGIHPARVALSIPSEWIESSYRKHGQIYGGTSEVFFEQIKNLGLLLSTVDSIQSFFERVASSQKHTSDDPLGELVEALLAKTEGVEGELELERQRLEAKYPPAHSFVSGMARSGSISDKLKEADSKLIVRSFLESLGD